MKHRVLVVFSVTALTLGLLLGSAACNNPPATTPASAPSAPAGTTPSPTPTIPAPTETSPAVEVPSTAPTESPSASSTAASPVSAEALGEGQILLWQRVGGLAGFCDRLVVYADGRAVAASCEAQMTAARGELLLNGDQKSQLNDWLRTLKPFDREQSDPATADGMSLRLVFAGTGDQEAKPSDWDALQGFAAVLFEEAARAGEALVVPETVQTDSVDEATL